MIQKAGAAICGRKARNQDRVDEVLRRLAAAIFPAVIECKSSHSAGSRHDDTADSRPNTSCQLAALPATDDRFVLVETHRATFALTAGKLEPRYRFRSAVHCQFTAYQDRAAPHYGDRRYRWRYSRADAAGRT